MKKTKATKNKENNSSTKSKKLTLKDQLNLEKDKYLRLFA